MNKFMKGLMVVVLSVGMLSGCESDYYEKAKPLMTSTERDMVGVYMEDYTDDGYDNTLKVLILKRSNTPYKNRRNIPFCDVVETLLEEENPYRSSYENFDAIARRWEVVKGETLRESCEKASNTTNQNSLAPTQIEVNSQIVADTVTLKDETLLSPKKIRELTDSVGTCNSAKVKLIMLTDTRKPLTISDYEVVTELIVGCEMDLLREELNK